MSNWFLTCLRCRGQMVNDIDGFKCAACGCIFYIDEKVAYTPKPLEYFIPSESGFERPCILRYVPVPRSGYEGTIRLEMQANCIDCGSVSRMYKSDIPPQKTAKSSIRLWRFACNVKHRFSITAKDKEPIQWSR